MRRRDFIKGNGRLSNRMAARGACDRPTASYRRADGLSRERTWKQLPISRHSGRSCARSGGRRAATS